MRGGRMRILVVSDIRVVQEGLNSVLAQQDGVDIISTVEVRHAKLQSAQLNPDIVLFDAARLESIGIVRDLVAASPHTKVVAFGVKDADAELLALAAAGQSAREGPVRRTTLPPACGFRASPHGTTGRSCWRQRPPLRQATVAA
jgi:hypothetical protein